MIVFDNLEYVLPLPLLTEFEDAFPASDVAPPIGQKVATPFRKK